MHKELMHVTHRALHIVRTTATNANLPPDEEVSLGAHLTEHPSNTTACGLDSWNGYANVIHVLEREYVDDATGNDIMDWVLEAVTYEDQRRRTRRVSYPDAPADMPTCPTCAMAWNAATAGLDWRTPERNAGQERDEREEHARLMDEVNDPRDFRRP